MARRRAGQERSHLPTPAAPARSVEKVQLDVETVCGVFHFVGLLIHPAGLIVEVDVDRAGSEVRVASVVVLPVVDGST